jgi:hypothetical protein
LLTGHDDVEIVFRLFLIPSPGVQPAELVVAVVDDKVVELTSVSFLPVDMILGSSPRRRVRAAVRPGNPFRPLYPSPPLTSVPLLAQWPMAQHRAAERQR